MAVSEILLAVVAKPLGKFLLKRYLGDAAAFLRSST